MSGDYMPTILLILTIGLMSGYIFISERRQKIFELKAWGCIKKVIIVRGSFTVNLMTMTGRGNLLLNTTMATIFFADDTNIKVIGITHFPPQGTYVKVYKNRVPEFRIEIDPMPPSSCL